MSDKEQPSTRDGAGPSGSSAAPMEIGVIQPRPSYADAARLKPLTDEERAHLLNTGGCFYCRQPGHVALKCPLRKGKRSAVIKRPRQ